jgi:hypothetical protein
MLHLMHHSKNTISLKSNLHLTNELICLEEYVNVIYQKTWHIVRVMLTGTPLVKDTKKRNFKTKNNIFYIFEELTAGTPILHFYFCFLKQCPGHRLAFSYSKN